MAVAEQILCSRPLRQLLEAGLRVEMMPVMALHHTRVALVAVAAMHDQHLMVRK
jgi:hypothetical protein